MPQHKQTLSKSGKQEADYDQIKGLTTELHNKEKSSSNHAHIKSRREEQRSKHERALDSIANIFSWGKSTNDVAAAALINGTLVVSSNLGNYDNYWKNRKIFYEVANENPQTKIAKTNFTRIAYQAFTDKFMTPKGGFNPKAQLTNKQLADILNAKIIEINKENSKLKLENKNLSPELQKGINNIIKHLNEFSNGTIENASKEAFLLWEQGHLDNIKGTKLYKIISNLAKPTEDINNAINFMQEHKEAFKQPRFITPPDKAFHAEMVILNELLSTFKNDTKGLNKNTYVGISRLCCGGCTLSLLMLRKHMQEGKMNEFKIGMIGAHSKFYPWATPPFFSNPENYGQFKDILTNAHHEMLKTLNALNKEGNPQQPFVGEEIVLTPKAERKIREEKGPSRLVNTESAKKEESTKGTAAASITSESEWLNADKIYSILRNYIRDMPSQVANLPAMNEETLKRNLRAAKSSTVDKFIIPLHIAADTHEVPHSNSGANSNHWAGIYIERNGNTITKVVYVDPMGEPIGENVNKLVRAFFKANNIEEPTLKNGMQYTIQSSNKGEITELQGNVNDCGVFNTYLLTALYKGKELPERALTEEESRYIGQILRDDFNKNEDFDIIHQKVQTYLHQNKARSLSQVNKDIGPDKKGGPSRDDSSNREHDEKDKKRRSGQEPDNSLSRDVKKAKTKDPEESQEYRENIETRDYSNIPFKVKEQAKNIMREKAKNIIRDKEALEQKKPMPNFFSLKKNNRQSGIQ